MPPYIGKWDTDFDPKNEINYMEKAIQKAIEGGYSMMQWEEKYMPEIYESYLLDPLFWQAIGKTMGWEKFYTPYLRGQTEWQSNWHRFIDHLAEGKDAENFFNELLK